MARPVKEPPTSSTLVPVISRYARARGVDVDLWTWRFGLPADVAQRDEVTVGVDVPEELLEDVAVATADADVALHVASELGDRRQRLVQLAVRATANVADALVLLARWTPLLHEGLEARVERRSVAGREDACWVSRTPRRPRGVGRHLHELTLAYPLLVVRAEAGDLPLSHVWFAHPRPPRIDGLRAFFGAADLAFGCQDSGFALPAALLDRPMRAADARTVETLVPLVDEQISARPQLASFAERVSAHVARSLPESTDVKNLARVMRMGARTLQRRLEQEGTTFTDVLDRARLDVARGLLADPTLSLAEVAFRLGFADLATFSRAFKRWTGVPPGQWRRS
jgi:AraC-like DNA-binding protein